MNAVKMNDVKANKVSWNVQFKTDRSRKDVMKIVEIMKWKYESSYNRLKSKVEQVGEKDVLADYDDHATSVSDVFGQTVSTELILEFIPVTNKGLLGFCETVNKMLGKSGFSDVLEQVWNMEIEKIDTKGLTFKDGSVTWETDIESNMPTYIFGSILFCLIGSGPYHLQTNEWDSRNRYKHSLDVFSESEWCQFRTVTQSYKEKEMQL